MSYAAYKSAGTNDKVLPLIQKDQVPLDSTSTTNTNTTIDLTIDQSISISIDTASETDPTKPFTDSPPNNNRAVAFLFHHNTRNARKLLVYHATQPPTDIQNPRIIVDNLSDQFELSVVRGNKLFLYLSLVLQGTEWSFQIYLSARREGIEGSGGGDWDGEVNGEGKGIRKWEWVPYMINWDRDSVRNEVRIHPWNGVLDPIKPWRRTRALTAGDTEYLADVERIGLTLGCS